MTESGEQSSNREVRVGDVVTKRPVWVLPLVAGSVLVMLMTLVYFGSIVDPGSHLRGLPVALVNEDAGVSTPSGRVDVGQQVVAGLTGSHAVTSRLSLDKTTLSKAEARMNKGADRDHLDPFRVHRVRPGRRRNAGFAGSEREAAGHRAPHE